MEIYHVNNDVEKKLQIKADKEKIPLGGAIELLPLCNMECKMCYVRLSKDEMLKQGVMLTYNEWIKIAKQATKEGLLFLLLTGGEPLLYPNFKTLYKELRNMGLILTINTNATLITEDWARFFSKCGCRRINITLYGTNDKTYNELCNNPHGFSQVMDACSLLKKYNVPFRFTCSLTPANVSQLKDLFDIAKTYDVPLSVATYMFPGVRRNLKAETQYRLSPKESANALLEVYKNENPLIDFKLAAQETLECLNMLPYDKGAGFPCHAGHSAFWINWKGDLSPCGMFDGYKISLLQHTFKNGWDYIVKSTQQITKCSDCQSCTNQNICHVCPAACYTETGRIDGKPAYLCEVTSEQIRLLKKEVSI